MGGKGDFKDGGERSGNGLNGGHRNPLFEFVQRLPMGIERKDACKALGDAYPDAKKRRRSQAIILRFGPKFKKGGSGLKLTSNPDGGVALDAQAAEADKGALARYLGTERVAETGSQYDFNIFKYYLYFF